MRFDNFVEIEKSKKGKNEWVGNFISFRKEVIFHFDPKYVKNHKFVKIGFQNEDLIAYFDDESGWALQKTSEKYSSNFSVSSKKFYQSLSDNWGFTIEKLKSFNKLDGKLMIDPNGEYFVFKKGDLK